MPLRSLLACPGRHRFASFAILVALLAAAAPACARKAEAPAGALALTVIHTNDVNGYLGPCG